MSTLKSRAAQIRDETGTGANTATRVGGLLLNMIERVQTGRTITDGTAELAATDAGTLVVVNKATDVNIIIPTATFEQDDLVSFWQAGAGEINIDVSATGSQSINDAHRSWGQDTPIQLWCYDATAENEVFKVIGGAVDE